MVGGDELRSAMRRFPSGIAVLTLPLPYGVTIGSLVSLSLDPPLVGVSIGLDAQAHELVREGRRFAVSVLGGDQGALAQHFARSVPPIAQWERVEYRESDHGPLLEGALAWLRCSVRAEHEAGDHTFFVADVDAIELGRTERGLVYRGGGYHPA